MKLRSFDISEELVGKGAQELYLAMYFALCTVFPLLLKIATSLAVKSLSDIPLILNCSSRLQ